MPLNTGTSPVVLELANGSSIQASLHMQDGELHVDVGWSGHFVIEADSAADLAQHILKLTEGVTHHGIS